MYEARKIEDPAPRGWWHEHAIPRDKAWTITKMWGLAIQIDWLDKLHNTHEYHLPQFSKCSTLLRF